MNNYKLLPSLVSILETRNLTESARILHVTQSAMSKTLAQIREAFDDPILIRESGQYVLTERGEQLRAQLPELLQQLDNLYLPQRLDLENCHRTFCFASSDYVAQALFPQICQQLAMLAPGANAEYKLWTKDMLLGLADSPVDLVSTIADDIPENLHGKKMAEDEYVIVCRADHPLANEFIDVDTYAEARHVVITGGGDKDSPVEKALERVGKKRRLFAKVPFFQSAIELLQTTDSLLTTPLHIAADFAQRYPLKLKPMSIEIKAHHYYLLWHAKHHHNPEHRWFREMCCPILKAHLETTIASGMKLLHGDK